MSKKNLLIMNLKNSKNKEKISILAVKSFKIL